MGDLRVTASTPTPAPASIDNARSATARAAQAAFFQAALGQAASTSQTAAVAAMKPVVAVTPSSTAVLSHASERARFNADAPPPTRPLRPGSLVDIKV